MAILGGREEHELFENCYRGGKKIVPGTTKTAANEVEKSNFLQVPAQLSPLQMVDWVSYFSSKV